MCSGLYSARANKNAPVYRRKRYKTLKNLIILVIIVVQTTLRIPIECKTQYEKNKLLHYEEITSPNIQNIITDAKYSYRQPKLHDQERVSSTSSQRRHALVQLLDEESNINGQYLPDGPPPFRPSSLMIKLNSFDTVGKVKQLPLINKMSQSKIYHTFLDVMRDFSILAEHIAHGKILMTRAKFGLIQSLLNRITSIGGHTLKLKWPLVLLNPNFLKEILSNPTFLVMLFHAVEVAYVSSPMNIWLKPLVKLVKQRSPREEEQVWWRRKRLYDVLNGIGSSEFQPNLKTSSFRIPGKQVSMAFPDLGKIFKKLGKHDPLIAESSNNNNQISDELSSSQDAPIIFNQEEWLMHTPSESELLTKEEFDALEPAEKERVINEARQRYEEFSWTNDLIQQQNDLIESLHSKMEESSGQGVQGHLDQTREFTQENNLRMSRIRL